MNYLLILLMLCACINILANQHPLEIATREVSSLEPTTSIGEKLQKVTAIYTTIKTPSPQIAKLIAASNKLLFANKPNATLSLQDQDVIKAPQYAAYKAAATQVNKIIPASGQTAIIWS